MSTGCRVIFLVAITGTLLCNFIAVAGPARSFAMVASRASKIPRSIRAPFRNNEISISRGFGKRSQMGKFKDSECKLLIKSKNYIKLIKWNLQ